jgi:hypothetical protein
MGCRLSLPSPPQEQLPSHAAGALLFGRLFKSPGFFRQPLLKGLLVFDARSFHRAASFVTTYDQ